MTANESTPTSRYWLGECPSGVTIRLKFTEVEPGQFISIPYEPRDVPCWASCPANTVHTISPCTAEEYEANDDELDEIKS